MYGFTTKPRKAVNGCFICGQERGAVIQALIGRLNRIGSMWLCAGCAGEERHRRAFIEEYGRRIAPAPVATPSERS